MKITKKRASSELTVPVMIEIPKGSRNKYEYDKELKEARERFRRQKKGKYARV